MYSPLIKALNYSLDQLSKIKVPGLPKFNQDRHIVFARSDARCIGSESHLQGSYKPDIVLVWWATLKNMQGQPQASFPISYLSDICCKSGCEQSKLNWRSLLSTVEVKLGSEAERADKRFLDKTYTSGFEDLSAEATVAEPPTSPPPAQPSLVREGYPARSRMSISPSTLVRLLTYFSPDSPVRKKQRAHTNSR